MAILFVRNQLHRLEQTLSELRDYQQRAFIQLVRAIDEGHCRIVLQLPVGSGKTRIAAEFCKNVLEHDLRLVFTVPMLSLVNQTVERFKEYGIHAVGVIQADHELTDSSQPIQVATVQTLRNRTIDPPHFLIVDEAHVRDEALEELLSSQKYESVVAIGLSATPWARGLGQVWKKLLQPVHIIELIQKSWLVPPRIFAPSRPDLRSVAVSRGDYAIGALSGLMSNEKLIGDVVQTWKTLASDRPTLCFAVDCAHAERLQTEFLNAGIVAEYIDADTKAADRDVIGDKLRTGEVQVVCNVGTLTTGVDWPWVSCISLCRPTKSEMLFCQIIGRGLRSYQDKVDCLVLDHSSTTLDLGLPTDINRAYLDDSKHTPLATPVGDKVRACPKCHLVLQKAVPQCPACGHRFPTVASGFGILSEMRSNWAIVPKVKPRIEERIEERQRWWSGFLSLARRDGRQRQWAEVLFLEKFGSTPDGLQDRLGRPDSDIRTWVHRYKNERLHRAAAAEY